MLVHTKQDGKPAAENTPMVLTGRDRESQTYSPLMLADLSSFPLIMMTVLVFVNIIQVFLSAIPMNRWKATYWHEREWSHNRNQHAHLHSINPLENYLLYSHMATRFYGILQRLPGKSQVESIQILTFLHKAPPDIVYKIVWLLWCMCWRK